jgi:hypothetical protein
LDSITNRGDNDRPNSMRLNARLGNRFRGGTGGEINGLLCGARAPALDNAGALSNPLIGGINRTSNIVIADHQVTAGSSQ